MIKNTAISAEEVVKNITFRNEEHKKFYLEYLPKCRYQDVYHKALVYCLGIDSDTRNSANVIYCFETGLVQQECLQQGWITSGSAKIIRMAFNLYCNGTPSVYDYENGTEEQIAEFKSYTVEDLFCCSYAMYFWEAVKIRYPEYARENRKLVAWFENGGRNESNL